MRRGLKLQMMSRNLEDVDGEPMTQKDRSEDVLSAFADDFSLEDLSADELDSLYSSALSEGVLTEGEIEASFENFLDRPLVVDPTSGKLSMAPKTSATWGSQIRSYRERRSKTIAQLASELGLMAEQVLGLESSSELYEQERTSESAKAISAQTGIAVARLHTLLQNVKATLEIQSASGPVLLAARKAFPK
jgi:hypothetical protein